MNWHGYHVNGPNERRRKGVPASCGLHRPAVGAGPVDGLLAAY